MSEKSKNECENCKRLRQEIDALKSRINEQSDQIKKLTDLVERAQRSGKRQAAPFRKKKNRNPKKPGRKPGDD